MYYFILTGDFNPTTFVDNPYLASDFESFDVNFNDWNNQFLHEARTGNTICAKELTSNVMTAIAFLLDEGFIIESYCVNATYINNRTRKASTDEFGPPIR